MEVYKNREKSRENQVDSPSFCPITMHKDDQLIGAAVIRAECVNSSPFCGLTTIERHDISRDY